MTTEQGSDRITEFFQLSTQKWYRLNPEEASRVSAEDLFHILIGMGLRMPELAFSKLPLPAQLRFVEDPRPRYKDGTLKEPE